MIVKLQVFHLMIGSSNMGKRLYFASYFIPFSSWYSKLIIFDIFCSGPFDDSLMYDCLLFDAYDVLPSYNMPIYLTIALNI